MEIQKTKQKNLVDTNMNPCKMCMPMGGALAIKGLEKSIVVMHSSQGCSTYIRRHIAQHYNEPMDIASSSLTEESTVYGGASNLKKALDNVRKIYNPKTIGITTSCLAETIGEDIDRIIVEYLSENKLEGELNIFSAGTPGYGGTEEEGYYFTLKRVVETFVKERINNKKVNIIAGMLTSAEIRRIKSVLKLMDVEAVILPDISETLDAPYYGDEYLSIARGGTPIEDIKGMGGALATIEMGMMVKDEHSPGKYLEEKFGVPLHRLAIPIGLENTDAFFKVLTEIVNKEMPEILKDNRARMIDGMIDSHKHNREGNAVIFGNTELVYSISKLCDENGIAPKVMATGVDSKIFKETVKEKIEYPKKSILIDADFETIGNICEEKKLNIAIGHSDGKCLESKYNLSLVRTGFPVHDRVGAQRDVKIFYDGSLRFLDTLTNQLLANKYQNYRSDMEEKYLDTEVIL